MVRVKYQSCTHIQDLTQESLMTKASSGFTYRDFLIVKKVSQNPVNPTHTGSDRQ
jgi:hypothetical protein